MLARPDDVEAFRALIEAAMSQLMKPFLDDSQIASSRAIKGLDTQLIEDGTYLVVVRDVHPRLLRRRRSGIGYMGANTERSVLRTWRDSSGVTPAWALLDKVN